MISVRLAKPGDGNAIACLTAEIQKLYHRALPEIFRLPHDGLFPSKKLLTLLKDADCIVAVAEEDKEVIGHIYGEVIRRGANEFRDPETSIYVHQTSVREEDRGRRIGTALIDFIEKRAKTIGANTIRLLGLQRACSKFLRGARIFATAGHNAKEALGEKIVAATPRPRHVPAMFRFC